MEGTARVVFRVEIPPPPRFIVADLVGRGHLFGLVPALDGAPHVAQLEAVSRTRAMFVPRPKHFSKSWRLIRMSA